MMAMYCRDAAAKDFELDERINTLYQELEAAYVKKLEFIQELESVSNVVATEKSSEFLHEKMMK